MMIIAIDGTTASGKGTISKRVSAKFGVPHMDTGRLYRATGIAALTHQIDLTDEDAVAAIAAKLNLSDFDDEVLRSEKAGVAASIVAVLPKVRAALFDLQRAFATQAGGALLDGRDIGTVIAPEADAKLWIDAEVEVRATRRHKEYLSRGRSDTFEDVLENLKARDERDENRKDAPSKKAYDAVLIDTTDMTIDAAVEAAIAVITTALAKEKS